MTFLIVTHVAHTLNQGKFAAYGPYVREMNLWTQHTQKVIIIAPLIKNEQAGKIDLPYTHPDILFLRVPAFELTSFYGIVRALCCILYIFPVLLFGMIKADHIHLRCPGNLALLGCLVQLLFPWKKKTAKYAGNWDWNSKQPWSYRLQQRILRSTLLTHNSKTLVYGEWPDRNKNILPFFTASYTERDKLANPARTIVMGSPIRFLFVGALTSGKRPIECLTFVNALSQQNISVEIHFYGEGSLKENLTSYIHQNGMEQLAFLHGNVNSDTLKTAYQNSHFLLLLSDSEGWPKAIAEAMWWGCVPIATSVSCVPWMLHQQERGLIIADIRQPNTKDIISLINNPAVYKKMAESAMQWARNYTLEKFNLEIQKLI
ncbi:MAG: glycosyltransferase family 4 protein [Bacteroidota bacterium]